MLPEYSATNFEVQSLSCPKCGWKGTGYDAVVIDFFGVTKSKEVHCPQCDTTIAVVTNEGGDAPGESATDLSFQTG